MTPEEPKPMKAMPEEDVFYITLKIKPKGKIIRVMQHLGNGEARETFCEYEKLSRGMAAVGKLIRAIVQFKA
jgi:hypothetical protein